MNWNWLAPVFNGIRIKRIPFVVLIILICNQAFAQESARNSDEKAPAVTFGSELDFPSQYVWHGLAWSKGAVMQPCVWATSRGFTFTGFANFDLDHYASVSSYNELDFMITYSREWKKVAIEPGFEYYTYPQQQDAPSTGMGVLKLSYPLGYLKIFTTHTFDVIEYAGAYFGELGMTYAHEFNSKLSLETSLFLGWGSSKFNEIYVGPRNSAINLVGYDASLSYYLNSKIYVRPHVQITDIIDKKLRENVTDPFIANFGLVIGRDF